jgi:hypothetical protein
MGNLQQHFATVIANGLKRRAVTSPSKWAVRYRMMGSPFPGPWSFDHHPWLREVHDAKHPQIVISKAAQMGFTETVLNITFYNIDVERRDCLYVLPSKTPDATDFSSARFDAALELSPHLSELFSDVKNVGHKRAGSANLYIRGSNSRSGLKSIPVGFIVFDELNEMDEKNVILAEERAAGQLRWQIFKLSTPTLPNKGISKIYDQSTKEHFLFKCPHCSRITELVFPECLVITAEDRLDPKIRDSYLVCKECHGVLKHEEKPNFLKNGFWEPTGPRDVDIRGFHIPQLYSSASKASPASLAYSYLSSLIDPLEAQELYNSKLGVAYVAPGSQITDVELINAQLKSNRCCNDIFDNTAPRRVITMGVDAGTWLHYVVSAWSLPGFGPDLNMNATCEVITAGKAREFSELGELMKRWQVMMCVIDAQPETRLAFEFAMAYYGRVRLCFYNHSISGRFIADDSNAHRVLIDRTTWLDTSLNRFRNGTVIIPKDISAEFQSQLKSPVRRYKEDKNGNPVGYYENIGPDHFAHAYNYSEVALPLAASITTNTDIKEFL